MSAALRTLAVLGALALVAPAASASDNPVTQPSAVGASAPTYLRKTKAPETRDLPREEAGAGGALRTGLAVLLLGGLAGAALWTKRRRARPSSLSPTLGLEVVSKTTLGPRSHLALVRIGSEAVLLGVTEQTITLLRSMPSSDLTGLDRGDEGGPTPAPTFPKTEAPTRRAIPEKRDEPAQHARVAFQDILERASLSEAKRRADARRYAESLHREAEGVDDEAPDSGPRALDDDDAMPAHLQIALEESRRDAFGEPDGQAAELVRRFRGRTS